MNDKDLMKAGCRANYIFFTKELPCGIMWEEDRKKAKMTLELLLEIVNKNIELEGDKNDK